MVSGPINAPRQKKYGSLHVFKLCMGVRTSLIIIHIEYNIMSGFGHVERFE